MEIRVHIERLILEGIELPPGGLAAFQAAVESELGRLLQVSEVAPGLSSGGAVPEVGASSLHLTGLETPAQLGEKVAGALFTGIGSDASPASRQHTPAP